MLPAPRAGRGPCREGGIYHWQAGQATVRLQASEARMRRCRQQPAGNRVGVRRQSRAHLHRRSTSLLQRGVALPLCCDQALGGLAILERLLQRRPQLLGLGTGGGELQGLRTGREGLRVGNGWAAGRCSAITRLPQCASAWQHAASSKRRGKPRSRGHQRQPGGVSKLGPASNSKTGLALGVTRALGSS